jgi:CDP-paratose 2-epimerase
MKIAIITGSGGLVGVECAQYFSKYFDLIIGIDNNSRAYFFGPNGSTDKNVQSLKSTLNNYRHYPVDIRDNKRIEQIFKKYSSDIALVINTAAQPSHDWSGKNPLEDFEINTSGVMTLLEQIRLTCPDAVFIQCSSSKVYGSHINNFEYQETRTRLEIPLDSKYYNGFTEDLQLDNSMHSPYGASKLAADVLSQEYGHYYGIQTGIFRPNCITGGPHSGVELHGFLSYLIKCTTTYSIFGYGGKQVRDNIHASDLARAFHAFFKDPTPGAVYNIGGGRTNSCSIIEAIDLVKQITGKSILYKQVPQARLGDHKWWITNNSKFQADYPHWKINKSLEDIIHEINQTTY